MKWHRIWAVVLRHMYLYVRSFDRISDAIYWPVMDILLWGITSKWMLSQNSTPHILLIVLSGLVYWPIVWRSNYEIPVNLLEEFWNQNLVNLFASPLKLREWIASVMVIRSMKMLVTIGVGAGAVWMLYTVNLFSVGWIILPFFALLMVSGWFMGFLASSMIVYWGTRIQTLAWTTGFLFAPFSVIMYPLSSLPDWVQKVAMLLPTTYIFEGMRAVIATGSMPYDLLLKSIVLNVAYLTGSILIFAKMFEKSRAKGLSRLE